MCSDAPPPPDFGPLADAMKQVGNQMFELGQQQLGFGQQRYQETMPLYQKMVSSNLEGQDLAMQLAREAATERLKYKALEDQIIQDTQRFDQKQAADTFAGQAGADMQQALSNQRAIGNRNLTRLGVNPNAGRFKSLNDEFGLRGAAMEAGARTGARQMADQQALAMKYNAAALGRNLPGTQLSAIGTGQSAGGATAGLLGAQVAPMMAGFQGAMGGLQGQMAGLGSVGNIMNQGYQNQMAQYNADQSALGGFGQLAGMGLKYALGGPAAVALADGGQVQDPRTQAIHNNAAGTGGAIAGPGTGTSDSVAAINKDTGGPVRVSNGEYIIPEDVVREKGKAFFDNLLEKHHKPVDGRRKKAIRSK